MKFASSHQSSKEPPAWFIYIAFLYRNENIISYKESFMEDSTQTLNIVMEFADGGDLLQRITQCKK